MDGFNERNLGEWKMMETKETRKKRMLKAYKEAGNICPCKNVYPESYNCEFCRGTLEEMESCFGIKFTEGDN